MIREILIAAAVGLIVNETTDISPWVAIRLARWAATRMYPTNAERAAARREEWEALIDRSIPGKISKLLFGLGLGCAGLYCVVIRYVPIAAKAVGRKIRRSFDLEWITAMLGMAAGLELGPSLHSVIVAGILIGCAVCLMGIEWIFEQVKVSVDRRRLSRGSL